MPAGPWRDQLTVLIDGSAAAGTELERLRADRSPQASLLVAEINAYEGDREAALAQLATAADQVAARGISTERVVLERQLRVSPFLRPLRDDPRWEPLLETIEVR
jgi:hypothetical protein